AVSDPAGKPAQVGEQALLHDAYGRLPLSFEENRGQTDPRVKFLSRGNGYSLFLTSTDAVLKLHGPSSSAHQQTPNRSSSGFSALRIRLKDANPTPEIAGIDQLA